jgi:hypothetical protein
VYDETTLGGLFGLAGFKVEKIMKIGWRGIAYLAKARKLE